MARSCPLSVGANCDQLGDILDKQIQFGPISEVKSRLELPRSDSKIQNGASTCNRSPHQQKGRSFLAWTTFYSCNAREADPGFMVRSIEGIQCHTPFLGDSYRAAAKGSTNHIVLEQLHVVRWFGPAGLLHIFWSKRNQSLSIWGMIT